MSQRLEGQFTVPFFSLPLPKYGKAPASFTLAPYVHLVYQGEPATSATRTRGFYPAVGTGFLFLYDLLRFDLARGLNNGIWTFSVDVAQQLWGIL
jgi:hypothetical protein